MGNKLHLNKLVQSIIDNDIMDEGGFGRQPGTVVKNVFWEGVRSLIDRGSITRRKGIVKPRGVK